MQLILAWFCCYLASSSALFVLVFYRLSLIMPDHDWIPAVNIWFSAKCQFRSVARRFLIRKEILFGRLQKRLSPCLPPTHDRLQLQAITEWNTRRNQCINELMASNVSGHDSSFLPSCPIPPPSLPPSFPLPHSIYLFILSFFVFRITFYLPSIVLFTLHHVDPSIEFLIPSLILIIGKRVIIMIKL